MSSARGWDGTAADGGAQDDFEAGGAQIEPGARRRKLAGYLKAANELRQTYQQSYLQGFGGNSEAFDDSYAIPGAYRDTGGAKGSGEEEMIIFPSYARRHIRRKPSAVPGTVQEVSGQGRDARDSGGAGDSEYWKQQWHRYEQDNAIVDVEVRGWIYTPHAGPLNRKNRLFIGLARQMVGIPAPAGDQGQSAPGTRASSPHGVRQRLGAHNAKHEEELVAKEAENLMRKGEAEADAAEKGTYSEKPGDGEEASDEDHAPAPRHRSGLTALQKRNSWTPPAQMSAAELAVANTNLMNRLKPFLAYPVVTVPISAFFYNEEVSRQRTIETDASGHFHINAALDFVPTHVRILASDTLSATVEIKITEPPGISVISDIDDTIKHSAIGAGAREIFRNVFIRDLGDLSIEGIREWYNKLGDMGVQFHYVSNSPWQLYPVLNKFFDLAGLPAGSFHLKAYSGMFQGIFEPVAERKKGTLEKILRDFPERRFFLIGDSGEADLEVYTDIVCENPGRVLGVFIRDITTPVDKKPFFDSSTVSSNSRRMQYQNSTQPAVGNARQGVDDDPDLKAAIAASIRDMEIKDGREGEQKGSDQPHRTRTEPPPVEPDLIDLDSDPEPSSQSEQTRELARSAEPRLAPPRPSKPRSLSAASFESGDSREDVQRKKAAPPVPARRLAPTNTQDSRDTSAPSQDVDRNQGRLANEARRKPAPPPPPTSSSSYKAAARQRLNQAYERIPNPSGYLRRSEAPSQQSSKAQADDNVGNDGAPPPLPARRVATDPMTSGQSQQPQTSYASSISNYAANLYNAATANTETDKRSLPNLRQQRQQQRQGPVADNSSSSDAYSTSTQPPPQAASKKVELWRRRWARAQELLGQRGVELRSWRVGTDIEGLSAKMVERALAQFEADRLRSAGGVKKTPKGRAGG